MHHRLLLTFLFLVFEAFPVTSRNISAHEKTAEQENSQNIPTWIHLRETGYFIGRTLYLVDVLPLAEPMASIVVNPANVGSAEVLLGPSSSLYGANASGGAINVRSLNGRDRAGITLGLGYGTFNTYRLQFSFGQKIGNWDFFGSYNADSSNGYKNTER